MIQNTLFMTHNTLFVNEITQTLFYAEIADFAICVWRTWSCVSSRLENVKRLVFCFYPLYSLPKPYPCGISHPQPPSCQWSEYWVVLASRQLVHRGCNHGWARASSLLLEDSNHPQQPHPQHQQYLQMQELGFQMIKIYPIHRILSNLLTSILHLVWAIGMHRQLILLSLCEKRRGLRYLFPTRSRSCGRWAVS